MATPPSTSSSLSHQLQQHPHQEPLEQQQQQHQPSENQRLHHPIATMPHFPLGPSHSHAHAAPVGPTFVNALAQQQHQQRQQQQQQQQQPLSPLKSDASATGGRAGENHAGIPFRLNATPNQHYFSEIAAMQQHLAHQHQLQQQAQPHQLHGFPHPPQLMAVEEVNMDQAQGDKR